MDHLESESIRFVRCLVLLDCELLSLWHYEELSSNPTADLKDFLGCRIHQRIEQSSSAMFLLGGYVNLRMLLVPVSFWQVMTQISSRGSTWKLMEGGLFDLCSLDNFESWAFQGCIPGLSVNRMRSKEGISSNFKTANEPQSISLQYYFFKTTPLPSFSININACLNPNMHPPESRKAAKLDPSAIRQLIAEAQPSTPTV